MIPAKLWLIMALCKTYFQMTIVMLMILFTDIYTLLSNKVFLALLTQMLVVYGLICRRIKEPDLHRPFKVMCCLKTSEGTTNLTIEQIHKSHDTPISYPKMHHSEQKCAHFSSEWCFVGYRAGAWRDLWGLPSKCSRHIKDPKEVQKMSQNAVIKKSDHRFS